MGPAISRTSTIWPQASQNLHGHDHGVVMSVGVGVGVLGVGVGVGVMTMARPGRCPAAPKPAERRHKEQQPDNEDQRIAGRLEMSHPGIDLKAGAIEGDHEHAHQCDGHQPLNCGCKKRDENAAAHRLLDWRERKTR